MSIHIITQPAYDSVRDFFHLSEEEKNKYMVVGGAGQGDTHGGSESAKDGERNRFKKILLMWAGLPKSTHSVLCILKIFGQRKCQGQKQCLICMMLWKSALMFYCRV